MNDVWKENSVTFFDLKVAIDVPYLYFVGPGCSSLGVGAFSENGPFRPNGRVLIRNEHSWNRGTNTVSLCVFLSFLKM